MVELASLNMVVDRLEYGFCWSALTWLLTGLNMVEPASLNSVVDRLVHACWNRLFMA